MLGYYPTDTVLLIGPDRNAEGMAIGLGCVVVCVLSKFYWKFFLAGNSNI